jgi:hypothetical protein
MASHVRLRTCVVASLPILLASYCAALADEAPTRVCAGDTQTLTKFEGTYVSKPFLDALKQTQSVPLAYAAVPAGDHLTAIELGPHGISEITSWHMALHARTYCVQVKDQVLTLASKSFIRAGSPGEPEARALMGMVFEGCFTDQLANKWCFTPGAVEIDGDVRRAELVLDMSEMWRDTALRLDGTSGGGSKFWYFRRTPAGGWQVSPGGWASDGPPEPDWHPPWRTLAPLSPRGR